MTTIINETDDELMRSLIKHYREIGSLIRPSIALAIVQKASKMSMQQQRLKLMEARMDSDIMEFSMHMSSGSFSKMMIIQNIIRKIERRSNFIKLN